MLRDQSWRRAGQGFALGPSEARGFSAQRIRTSVQPTQGEVMVLPLKDMTGKSKT